MFFDRASASGRDLIDYLKDNIMKAEELLAVCRLLGSSLRMVTGADQRGTLAEPRKRLMAGEDARHSTLGGRAF